VLVSEASFALEGQAPSQIENYLGSQRGFQARAGRAPHAQAQNLAPRS